MLEIYKNTEFTIADINYNNYNSFIDGKFFEENIEEISVVIPNRQEALKFKQTNDTILSGGNFKDLFLRSNSIFGIVCEYTLKTKKILNEYTYLYIETPDIPYEDVLEFFKGLEEFKKTFLAKDIIMSKKGNSNKIFLKTKRENVEKIKQIFEEKDIKIENFNKDEYFKYRSSYFDACEDENIFRKLKLRLHSDLSQALRKINNYAKDYNVEFSYHFEQNSNALNINVYSEDEINSIEKSLHFIRRVQGLAEKNKGNIFCNIFFYIFILFYYFLFSK
jgi:hypothetical protein